MEAKEKSLYQRYGHLIPDITKWPITKFAQNRKAFIHKLNQDVFRQFSAMGKEELDQSITRTIYLERQRVKSNPWKADPPNEQQYYRKVQNEYNANQLLPDRHKGNLETLGRLINRFSQEIMGHFNIKTFLFARKVSDFFFHLLLYPFGWQSIWNRARMREKNIKSLKLNGYVSEVRRLFQDHVVILVPTHSSNLDSILIGYAMDMVAGLPAFSYGAGLNLYDSEFFAFFMNRLGAYKVDRRKKNSIYLHTLTAYSKLSVFEGVNTIFFPGGTRSRSGDVETKLKLGLLGSLIQAQRLFLESGLQQKVVIVPVVIGYESVLEARSLIVQHLAATGQERYTSRLQKNTFSSYLAFINRFLKSETQIYLTMGKPMDVFGNEVDSNGQSWDHKGHVINLEDYFKSEGVLIRDEQREMIYTRELGERIADSYKRYNYVLPVHLVAHAAFLILSKMNPQHDVYSLVQLPEEDYFIHRSSLQVICLQLRNLIMERVESELLIYPVEIDGDIDKVIDEGIMRLGIFHNRRILRYDQFDRIVSEDFHALHFYANKLNNLELANELDWSSIQFETNRF